MRGHRDQTEIPASVVDCAHGLRPWIAPASLGDVRDHVIIKNNQLVDACITINIALNLSLFDI